MGRKWMVGGGVATLALVGFTVGASTAERAPVSDDELAIELVHRWIESVGGMESYWAMEGARFTLTTELYDVDTGRMKRARPRYVTIERLETGEAARIERWEGNDFIQQGFDGGETLWAVMNGEFLAPGDKDYDEALYVARDVFYWISLPYKLKDPGVFLAYGGTDAQGRHVVEVSFGEDVGEHDDTWFYTFEEGRTMPVDIAYREEGKDNINHTYWEDFREVDGFLYAGRRVSVNDDGQITKVLVTTEFELNPGTPAEVFLRP